MLARSRRRCSERQLTMARLKPLTVFAGNISWRELVTYRCLISGFRTGFGKLYGSRQCTLVQRIFLFNVTVSPFLQTTSTRFLFWNSNSKANHIEN